MQGDSAETIGGGTRHEMSSGEAGNDTGGVMGPLWRLSGLCAMGALFVTTVIPIGLAMRALGKDPLRLRRDPDARSYWVARDPPGPAPGTMTRQS